MLKYPIRKLFTGRGKEKFMLILKKQYNFKKQYKKKRSRKLLIRFVLSFLVILFIPIIIGSVVYVNAIKMVEEGVIVSKTEMLKQLSTTIDSRIEGIYQIIDEIAMNFWINKFLSVGSSLSGSDLECAKNIIKELQLYRNNEFIRECYIYFKKSDKIITPNAMYSPKLFYNFYCSLKDVEFDEWYVNLRELPYSYHKVFNIEVIIENYPAQMIAFLQSLPLTNTERVQGLVVLLIDKEKIIDMLSGVADGGLAYILDNKNNVIVKVGETNIPIPDNIEFEKGVNLVHSYINGNDTIVMYVVSPKTNWKYVLVIPTVVFMKKVGDIRNLVILTVGICLLIGIVVTCFLARKNYSPIQRIVETLSRWGGTVPDGEKHELDFVKDLVESIFNENKRLEKKVEDIIQQKQKIETLMTKNRMIIKNALLTSLVRGQVDDFDAIKMGLEFYGVQLPYDNFVVAVIHINNYKNFDKESNFIKFVIITVIEEFLKLNEDVKGYGFVLEDGAVASVVNIRKFTDFNNMRLEIIDVFGKLKHFLKEKFEISITVGIGNLHNGPYGANMSLEEARKAIDYKIVRGHGSIIFFDEITEKDKGYYYPIDDELRLINSIKMGDFESCKSILEKIFEENFSKRRLPLVLIKCLYFDIMSTLIKVLDAININYTDIFGKDFNVVEILSYCETVDDIYQKIYWIYEKLCNYISSYHKSKQKEKLKNLILQYIHSNYMDESLSQTVVADNFGMSYSYLSKFFNEEVGESMVDYINRLRVNKAKWFLLNSELPLDDIAKKVGLNSSKNLIRVFKKFEGVTPGAYRKYH